MDKANLAFPGSRLGAAPLIAGVVFMNAGSFFRYLELRGRERDNVENKVSSKPFIFHSGKCFPYCSLI